MPSAVDTVSSWNFEGTGVCRGFLFNFVETEAY